MRWRSMIFAHNERHYSSELKKITLIIANNEENQHSYSTNTNSCSVRGATFCFFSLFLPTIFFSPLNTDQFVAKKRTAWQPFFKTILFVSVRTKITPPFSSSSIMNDAIIQFCSTCKELAGFYCNGCNKIFCQPHADEHRQSLYEQFDWLAVDHDDLVQKLNQTSTIMQRKHPSRRIIDKWEEESIEQIRQTANEARHALMDVFKLHLSQLREKLKLLTDDLNQIYENQEKTFDERNIKQWATDLRNIKQDFLTTPAFTVRIHGNKPVVMPIIKIQPERTYLTPTTPSQKPAGLISIKSSQTTNPFEALFHSTQSQKPIDHPPSSPLQKDDRFHSKSNHVKILDYGQLIIHDSTNEDASILGLNEYSHGAHRLFFRIERLPVNEWIFFGIMSKHGTFSQKAHTDTSAHGWTGYNNVYIHGKSMPVLNGYLSNMQVNDFVELTIDCDRETLHLWHSRQMYKNKLPIDRRTCPFPWQFLISCHNANASVRLLPLSIGSIIKLEQDKLNQKMKIKEIEFPKRKDSLTVQQKSSSAEII
ncbi:unnamed protein product [Adineta ricciae]|uniref:B box-type domain-containing protein n=1 Tax=Adineta ricciae TaxID=249248 RepID=A0A815K5G7_ADIRI|nr:unnamed protein product [Adineta ricciae]